MEIKYKGKVVNTTHYQPISDERYNALVSQYMSLPSIHDVRQQMQKIHKGGVANNYITNYYFKDLMLKVKILGTKWSISEVLQCKKLVECMLAMTNDNKKIYPDAMPDAKKLDTVFRLRGMGYAKKPTQFPMKTANYILTKYNINNNYYDFSCGWGIRLMGALKNNINYYGTDPNYLLVERLQLLYNEYNNVNNTDSQIDIRACGSETLIPEWINKMGLAFTSPPYYCLEDYQIGNQSYKEGVTYSAWLNNYLHPTICNIHKYLIDKGVLAININNFKQYNLVEDTIAICNKCGFKLIEIERLDNIKRCNTKSTFNDNSEGVFIFVKDCNNTKEV